MSVQNPTQSYLAYLREHRWYYLAGIIMMVATSLSEVMVPKFSQWAIDLLVHRHLQGVPEVLRQVDVPTTLNAIMGLFLFTMMLGWLGRIGWRQTFARRTHHAGYLFKKRFWESLHDQPMEVFQKYHLGDLMNRSNADWNNARFIHGFTMVLTFDVIFVMALSIVAMVQIDAELTIACLLIMPFLPRLIKRLLDLEAEQHSVAQEKLSHLTQLLSQAIHTVRLQRATASEGVWEAKLRDEAKEYAGRRYEVIRTSRRIFPLGALPTLIAAAILLSWGLYKVIHRQLTIGELVALQSYVILLQAPLFDLGDVLSEWQTGFTSFRRLHEIFSLKKNRPPDFSSTESSTSAMTDHALTLRALCFHYPDSPRLVIDQVNLAIPKGRHLGLTGAIGAGKSTLASLISGLLSPTAGHIEIFGQDAAALSPTQRRSQVLLVPQKAFLFSGTVRSNLSLEKTFSDDELWDMLALVQIKEEISHLPDGLDAYIGEWGHNLSGGQKQRLALARALLHPKPILLMDDCLSAVDVGTEEKIIAGMERALQDATVVWIAHRLSTLRSCSQIYEMRDGALRSIQGGMLP